MKLKRARERIHEMKSSLSVLDSYVTRSLPPEDDELEREFKQAAVACVGRMRSALEEVDDIMSSECQRSQV